MGLEGERHCERLLLICSAVHTAPTVGPDLFRWRKSGGHQEAGQYSGVKTDDFFATVGDGAPRPETRLLVLRACRQR